MSVSIECEEAILGASIAFWVRCGPWETLSCLTSCTSLSSPHRTVPFGLRSRTRIRFMHTFRLG